MIPVVAMFTYDLHRVHPDAADPAPTVDLADAVHSADGDKPSRDWVADDHIQSLGDVALDKAGDAVPAEDRQLSDTEVLIQQMSTTDMQRGGVLTDDVEEGVVAGEQVGEHALEGDQSRQQRSAWVEGMESTRGISKHSQRTTP